MKKISKGDQVVVLSGRDKGRRGAVLQVLADGRLVVESINWRRSTPSRTRRLASRAASSRRKCRWRFQGRALEPGHQEGRPRRGEELTDGKSVRFFKSNGEMIDA